MSEQRDGRRYAQAILEAVVEQWQMALGSVADALAQNPQLAANVETIEEAIPADASQEVKNFVKMLVQEGDTALLPSVITALSTSLRGESRPQEANITSAIALGDAEKEQIRQQLTTQYGDGLRFSFDVDAALMGGLRIRVGDQLIDNTIASRLLALRDVITSAVR